MTKRLLVLENGMIFEGEAFGADLSVTREIELKPKRPLSVPVMIIILFLWRKARIIIAAMKKSKSFYRPIVKILIFI